MSRRAARRKRWRRREEERNGFLRLARPIVVPVRVPFQVMEREHRPLWHTLIHGGPTARGSSSISGVRPMFLGALKLTRGDLAIARGHVDSQRAIDIVRGVFPHNPNKWRPSRHDVQRWLRKFSDLVAVASDALLEGDRARAIEILCEMIFLHEAVHLTSCAVHGRETSHADIQEYLGANLMLSGIQTRDVQ